MELYCYRVKAGIGALAAALGGLETLVFAGGIGENSPRSGAGSATGSGSWGWPWTTLSNEAGAAVISADGGPVTLRVIRTDEEVMIARAAAGVFARAAGDPPRPGGGVVWACPVSTLRNTSEDEDARGFAAATRPVKSTRRGRRRDRARDLLKGEIVMENTLPDHSEAANGARPTPPEAVSAEGRDDPRPAPAATPRLLRTPEPRPGDRSPSCRSAPGAGAPSHPWRRGCCGRGPWPAWHSEVTP